MNARLSFFVVVSLMLSRAGSILAEGPDLADLAPARTVAFLELHDPPALAREFHALIKGSYLQRPDLLFANHMKKGKKINEEAFLIPWICSPEFIDEMGGWQGGFLALTGLTKNDQPEIVGVLRTGKSRIFPLALRMILLESGIHCIARVEGIPIFQIGDAEKPQREIAQRLRVPAIQLVRLLRSPPRPSLYQVALLENAAIEEPDEKPESGLFLSLLPDGVAFGTTPDVLSDTIRRYKSKSSAPSLTIAPAFRAASEMRNRPGLFIWSDPPRLTQFIDEALHRKLERHKSDIRVQPPLKDGKPDAAKLREMLQQAELDHRSDTQEWRFLQKAANLAAMYYAATSWSLHKGEFSFRVEARMRDKQISPLLDILANQKLSSEFLQAVPGDAFCLFAIPLSDGATTLARLLKFADAFVLQSGEGTSLPSKEIAELEKQLKLRLGRDVLAKFRSAAVAVHVVEDKEHSVYPVFILEAVSENAAKDLVSAWPRLCAMGGKRIEPHRHALDGQEVRSLSDKPADSSLSGLPPHYGHRGNIVVLGWHRTHVGSVLRSNSHKKDLLNLQRGLSTVDAEGAVSALGLFSCRQLLARLTDIGSTAPNQGAGHRQELRYLRELSTPMALMPPTLFTVKRLADGVRLEFRQSELPVASATVVDIALTWLLDAETAPSAWLSLLFGAPPAPPGAAPAMAAPAPIAN
ncbi:MAG TPA: hypothetical protein VH592_11935 [Gemmataceae bacterium]|jgi:hypothetical protein